MSDLDMWKLHDEIEESFQKKDVSNISNNDDD